MDESTRLMQLADEQAANTRYLAIMRAKIAMKYPIAVSASARWTGSGLPVPTEPTVGALVGRVGLNGVDDVVGGTNFYIGPWHVDEEGLVVFSWAAPVAASFYGHRSSNYELTRDVVVCRTMQINQPEHRVEDFFDEWFTEESAPSPFAAKQRLTVPKPPGGSQGAITEVAKSTPPDSQRPLGDSPDSRSATKKPARIGIRAEDAVRAALAAPRGSALPSLLATLQPDQYDLVTRPIEQLLAIQGHPGTGKTVIAAHRAAYLVHPEQNPDQAPPKILLLGPNAHYARHVAGVLGSLITQSPSPVTAMGIGEFLGGLRRLPIKVTGPLDGEHYEVSIELGDFAEAAAHELRLAGELLRASSQEEATRMVYGCLKANHAAGVQLTDDRDWITDLKKLPDWKTAVRSRRFLPLIAQCALSAVPISRFTFDHVIVDEAQDIRPLEWRLIKAVNPTSSWTLLGDMNQRRSDWSYHSWTALARDLDLVEEDADFNPLIFSRGYRSTAPIINFANHLLPRNQRTVESIQQEGPEPLVRKVPDRTLIETVIEVAADMARRYMPGSTAIIAVDRNPAGRAMIKNGWTLDPNDQRCLKLGDMTVHLLTPDAARGLEFDAVVVQEPAEFPPNLGRMGSLYTSLTRANRELAVVHSKPLPDGLRGRR